MEDKAVGSTGGSADPRSLADQIERQEQQRQQEAKRQDAQEQAAARLVQQAITVATAQDAAVIAQADRVDRDARAAWWSWFLGAFTLGGAVAFGYYILFVQKAVGDGSSRNSVKPGGQRGR